jgi:hypothetical protein
MSMEKIGTGITIFAFWLAVIGLVVAVPYTALTGDTNLFDILFRGFHIPLVPGAAHGSRYAQLAVSSGQWLALCAVIYLIGACIKRAGGGRLLGR